MGDYKFDDADSDFNKIYDQHFYQTQYYDYLNHQHSIPQGSENITFSESQQSYPNHKKPATFSHTTPSTSQYSQINDSNHTITQYTQDHHLGTDSIPTSTVPGTLFPSSVDNYKRKISQEDIAKAKKERPHVVRQNLNPTKPGKRKGRPSLNKAYSYAGAMPNKPKTKPNFYLNLDHLKNSSVTSFDSMYTTSSQTPQLGMAIQDYDLNLDREFDNTTPGMKPPGTNENEYFEDLVIPSNFDSKPDEDLSGFNFSFYDNDYYDNEHDKLSEGVSDHGISDHGISDHGISDHGISDNGVSQLSEWDVWNHNQLQPGQIDSHKKSPTTPLSNSSASRLPPLVKVASSQSLSSMNSSVSTKEKQKRKKPPKGATCNICGKYISRDLTRHLRIHDEMGRFRCVYPDQCSHKTGKFNRPYDYKKHLLHFHFRFDDKLGKTANNLTDKLPLMGFCTACNGRFKALDWLDHHVLTADPMKRCSYATVQPNPH